MVNAADQMSDEEVEAGRATMTGLGAVAEGASVDELRQVMARAGRMPSGTLRR